MITANLTLKFPQKMIGHPYWPEMWKVIEITKSSGMNRARTEANRRKALEEELRRVGMTYEEFLEIKAKSERPFHVNQKGNIVIPSDIFLSFMVATAYRARSAHRLAEPEQVRSRFIVSDFVTDRTKPDGLWERFATVTAGTGQKLSNQRAYRANHYIAGFTAKGSLTWEPEFVRPDALENALRWGGAFVGIGASRKMGHGRFEIEEFKVSQ